MASVQAQQVPQQAPAQFSTGGALGPIQFDPVQFDPHGTIVVAMTGSSQIGEASAG